MLVTQVQRRTELSPLQGYVWIFHSASTDVASEARIALDVEAKAWCRASAVGGISIIDWEI
jgi:hypothetical protein